VLKGVVFFIYSIDYLLHVLFVLKIEGIFGKEKISSKMLKELFFFIYGIEV